MFSRFYIVIGFLVAILLSPINTRAETTDEEIARATKAIEAVAPRAQTDPARPTFHVTSPAQWVNDPNGPIFFKGFYHLFYQLDPFSDHGGPKYWGHVRSRDLSKWEPLPIALSPDTEAGEAEVWSGCCTVNGLGQPMIFYTSIAQGKSPQDHAEQWAAVGDDQLLHWQRSPANPVLSEALHDEKKVYDWRDPFVFHEGKKAFLVAGGNLNHAQGGQAVVNIYEAQNAALTHWTYRGVLYQVPDVQARTAECPNFFKLGDEWVLFLSPYGKVQYFIGDFDIKTCRFHARTNGLLDIGPNFYAPSTMQVPDGRRLVWGWVTGFPNGHGWNGCLTLPRLLSVSHDGELLQKPAPQLTKLRGPVAEWRNVPLANENRSFSITNSMATEILLDVDLHSAKEVEFQIKGSTTDAPPLTVKLNGSELQGLESRGQLKFSNGSRKLNLHIFIDHSVLEVFANDEVCLTKLITPLGDTATLQIRNADGGAIAKRIQVWPIKTIW